MGWRRPIEGQAKSSLRLSAAEECRRAPVRPSLTPTVRPAPRTAGAAARRTPRDAAEALIGQQGGE